MVKKRKDKYTIHGKEKKRQIKKNGSCTYIY